MDWIRFLSFPMKKKRFTDADTVTKNITMQNSKVNKSKKQAQ